MLGQTPLHYAVTMKAPEEIMLRLVLGNAGCLDKKMGSKKGEIGMTPFCLATSLSDEGKLTDDDAYILEVRDTFVQFLIRNSLPRSSLSLSRR